MTCPDIDQFTPLYLSDELDEARQRGFDAHLKQCGRCADALSQQRSLDASLREALSRPLPGTARLEHAVRTRITAGNPRRVLYRVAAAAAAVVLLGLSYMLMAPRATARVYTEAARDHRREVVEHQPRRWKSDAAALDALATEFGLTAETAASLAPAGYRFKQAKTCGLDGRPALHLVYENGASEFSAYLQPHGTAKLSAIRQVTVGHEHLAAFHSARFDVVVVTDASRSECLKLAQSTARLL